VDPSYFIFFQGFAWATAFWVWAQGMVAGWLWSNRQADPTKRLTPKRVAAFLERLHD